MIIKQYTIGEFATINKVTPRMLRHYDKIGIFKPSDTLSNGYRSYDTTQIPMICQIKQYQQCGFSLAEIEMILKYTEEEIKNFAQKKKEVFHENANKSHNQWENLCVLSGTTPLAFVNNYEISILEKNEQILFHKANPVMEDDIERSFDNVFDAVKSMNIQPWGIAQLMNNVDEDRGYSPTVPIKKLLKRQGYVSTIIPFGRYLSTIHYGSYESLGNGYDSLLCYADSHGFATHKIFFERYFVDRTLTSNHCKYITEILLKIT